jgi:hypothetical protein
MFAVLASAAGAQTYGGSATGAAVTVPATGTVIRAASGTVSISGGGAHAALLAGEVPGSATGGVVSLSAGALRSAIVGLDATRGEASMGEVALTVSGNQISADFVMARANAACGPAVGGSSEIGNLVINNQAIAITGNPNQTVSLPNGTVVINQQSSTLGATSAELIVNALHIKTRDAITGQELADVVLANVDTKINCQGGSASNASFGTGGGWIPGLGGRATFGVMGGADHDGTKAHVVFKDHGANFNLQSTTEVVDNTTPCETRITGTAESTLGPTEFAVIIRDSGEPGAGRDQFTIQTSVGYTNSDFLGGGNIQKHREACTTP